MRTEVRQGSRTWLEEPLGISEYLNRPPTRNDFLQNSIMSLRMIGLVKTPQTLRHMLFDHRHIIHEGLNYCSLALHDTILSKT